jgi:hypothetical protein
VSEDRELEFVVDDDGSVRPVLIGYSRLDARIREAIAAGPERRGPGRPKLDAKRTRATYLAAARLAFQYGRRHGRADPPTAEDIAAYVPTPDRAIDRGVESRTVQRWIARFGLPTGADLLAELERDKNSPG